MYSSVETPPRDQAEPSIQAALPEMPDHRTRPGEGGHLLRRIANLLRPTPKTGVSYHDPLFAQPDIVENDYYRFRHQPGG
jgi:hypothetical protein